MHEGSGFAMTEAEVAVDGKTVCNADITFRLVDFPKGEFRAHMHKVAERIAFPMERGGAWLRHARHPVRPGSPASASCRVSARGSTRIGRRSARAHRRPTPPPIPPYVIHKLAPLDFDKQIPKKGDQRQMEAWQRIGTYAAGLALDSAGVKGNTEVLSRTDMIVAAGGGERDITADTAILSGLTSAEKPDAYLNERLMSDLRPTLFLAQLSNLLAGNISIVHGVTGSSRTFMGEESAGVDAVRIALSRIEAGQSDIALVGGSHNSERPDLLMLYEFAGYALKDKFAPVWQREANAAAWRSRLAGRIPGHGIARPCRGARRQAHRAAFHRRCRTASTASRATSPRVSKRLWDKIAGRLQPGKVAVISGASGRRPRPPRNAHSWPGIRILPFAPPGLIWDMRLNRSFP